MKRDIKNIVRDLENKKNNDIIFKKNKLLKEFLDDPDLQEVLNKKNKKPLNKYVDKNNPTEEELKIRKSILEYNEKVDTEQIFPYLKLNGIQKEVLNFIMFDINDSDVSYSNEVIKNQMLTVMCLVHEDDMETEFNIIRTDLLSYIVKDLLNWSNVLGFHLKMINDFNDIIDNKYYCRTIKFKIEELNLNRRHMGVINRYDKLP